MNESVGFYLHPFEDGTMRTCTRRALIGSVFYPGQMGTDLNPTENAFGGDPEKMYNEGRVLSLIVHLRPQAPPQMGTPALPRPRCVPTRFCFGYINAQFDRACLNTMKTLLKKSNENSERVLFEYAVSLSETELRAAQPNLHRGRAFAHVCKSRREPATSQARRDIK